MEPGSKISFNIGLIYATRGEHQRAIDSFEKAIELDPYLAVAYFQAGVSQFLLGRHEIARRDFDDAWLVRCERKLDHTCEKLIGLLDCSTFVQTRLSITNSELPSHIAFLSLRLTVYGDHRIGLKFQLYSCEVLFNRGLCLVYMVSFCSPLPFTTLSSPSSLCRAVSKMVYGTGRWR